MVKMEKLANFLLLKKFINTTSLSFGAL